jgi:ornithine cyclodeaminase
MGDREGTMQVLTGEEIRALAPLPRLIDALEEAFRAGGCVPPRHIASVPGGTGGRLLLSMPAFDASGGGAVKLATVYPDNAARGLPTIQATIVVFSERGMPIALLDGTTVTRLRTGAASALASRYLSRPDSAHLVIVGAGALAPYMAAAHCAVRPIRRISVWGRRAERAAATAAAIRERVDASIEVHGTASLDADVATADIVSCSTSSASPVLAGQWLAPGAFVDLVGSFSPSRREADDEVVRRARLFVDTFEGALAEAGDLLDPLARGVIARERIEGELADLVRGRVAGRRTREEITLFKSVGTALEDLAAARLILTAAARAPTAG